MADESSIVPSNDDRKAEIRKQVSSTEIELVSTDIYLDVSNAVKLPFDQLANLGIGLSPIYNAFQKITTTIELPDQIQLFENDGVTPVALDRLYNAIPTESHPFRKGLHTSGYRDATNNAAQICIGTKKGETVQLVTEAAFDPTLILVAVALAQVNAKLDSIQAGVDKIYEYLKLHDEAERRANLEALQRYLNDYKHNWNNKTWISSAHNQVATIKREAKASMIQLRAQIEKETEVGGPFDIRLGMKDKLQGIVNNMNEYRMAVYTYAFASFLEPMLSENYSEAYLTEIAGDIRDQGIAYRKLYSKCYDSLEKAADKSVDSLVMDGVAGALGGLSGLIAKTPLGDATQIDEALADASDNVDGLNDSFTAGLLKELRKTHDPDIRVFSESVDNVNALYNKPHKLLADKDALYLLPGGEE